MTLPTVLLDLYFILLIRKRNRKRNCFYSSSLPFFRSRVEKRERKKCSFSHANLLIKKKNLLSALSILFLNNKKKRRKIVHIFFYRPFLIFLAERKYLLLLFKPQFPLLSEKETPIKVFFLASYTKRSDTLTH